MYICTTERERERERGREREREREVEREIFVYCSFETLLGLFINRITESSYNSTVAVYYLVFVGQLPRHKMLFSAELLPIPFLSYLGRSFEV